MQCRQAQNNESKLSTKSWNWNRSALISNFLAIDITSAQTSTAMQVPVLIELFNVVWIWSGNPSCHVSIEIRHMADIKLLARKSFERDASEMTWASDPMISLRGRVLRSSQSWRCFNAPVVHLDRFEWNQSVDTTVTLRGNIRDTHSRYECGLLYAGYREGLTRIHFRKEVTIWSDGCCKARSRKFG